MAVTVVLVVTFLFGVLVGRDVRPSASPVEVAGAEVSPDVPPPGQTGQLGQQAVAPAPESPVPPVASSSSSSGAASGAAQPAEQLSYAERLLRDAPAEENLKPPAPAVREPVAAPPPAPKPTPAEPAATPPRTAAPTATPAAAAKVTPSDPSGPGFAVQVSIFPTRQEADGLVRQLVAKGYPAFVLDPAKGAAKPIYRVRVGKYRNRKDAEEIQARLEKNEQFTPWIAR